MVSILSMINSYLSYINLNVKIKNRVYTILATIGNFYLLYVSYRFFANGFIVRGLLFILAFLVIAYFAYLNILYYFTDNKKSRYDISPWIEKTFHLQPKDPLAEAAKKKAAQAGFVQTNGIFKNADFLPAEVAFSEQEKKNIQELVPKLVQVGYLTLDYDGQSDDTLFELAKRGQAQRALGQPKALPYFELVPTDKELLIYGGLNQMERVAVGHLKTVGLMPALEAYKKYHLYLATALVTGGPVKVAGRVDVIEKEEPFSVEVQLAYRKRGQKAHASVNEQVEKPLEQATPTYRRSRRK